MFGLIQVNDAIDLYFDFLPRLQKHPDLPSGIIAAIATFVC